MRNMILGAALPVAARADVPAVTVGHPVDDKATAPGTMTWKVSLKANAFYAFGTLIETTGKVHFTLKDASGDLEEESFYNPQDGESGGGSFFAPYTGDYFITATTEALDGGVTASGQFFVNVDCVGGSTTICTLPVGTVRTKRQFDFAGDADDFKTRLQARKRYTVTLNWPTRQPADCFVLSVSKPNGLGRQYGRVTVRPDGSIAMDFTAQTTGKALIEAGFRCDYAAPLYDIGLALRK